MYTIGAAYAVHQEKIKDLLSIGNQADLVILSENSFISNPIKDREVIETFNGTFLRKSSNRNATYRNKIIKGILQ